MLGLAEAACDNARNYLFSALHRNGDGLRKPKRQLSLGSERDISFREQFLRVRELRIQLTLRPWPIADPRR